MKKISRTKTIRIRKFVDYDKDKIINKWNSLSNSRKWAYIAGFIDGEGTLMIRLHKNTKHKGVYSPHYFRFAFSLTACNTNRLVIELILTFIKEYVYKKGNYNIYAKVTVHNQKKRKMIKEGKVYQTYYALSISNLPALLLIMKRILPYSIVKYSQIKWLIKACKLRLKYRQKVLPKKTYFKILEIRDKIHRINGVYKEGYRDANYVKKYIKKHSTYSKKKERKYRIKNLENYMGKMKIHRRGD